MRWPLAMAALSASWASLAQVPDGGVADAGAPGGGALAAVVPESDRDVVARMTAAEVSACLSNATVNPRCEQVARVCTGHDQQPETCNAYVPHIDEHALRAVGTLEPDYTERLKAVAADLSSEPAVFTPDDGSRGGPRPIQKLSRTVIDDIDKCSAAPDQCVSLADFKNGYAAGYAELRLWCAENTSFPNLSIRWQPGVDPVCSAMSLQSAYEAKLRQRVGAATTELGRVERRVAQTVASLTRLDPEAVDLQGRTAADELVTSQKASADAATALEQAKAARKGVPDAAKKLVEAKTREAGADGEAKKAAAAAERVSGAKRQLDRNMQDLAIAKRQVMEARAGPDAEASNAPLKSVDAFELTRLGATMKRDPQKCGGWGLTLPLFSFRHVPEDFTYSVKGPVEAGIGGGYYLDLYCDTAWTWGLETFLLSEGLDPSKDFHIAFATGPSLAAFRFFHFGIALSYDLVRFRVFSDGTSMANGLFTRNNGFNAGNSYLTNLAMLFTFTLVGQSGSTNNTSNGAAQTTAASPASTPASE